MKAKDLIIRKEQLQQSKTQILKQIAEETAQMARVDLEKFIASGDPGQINGENLSKLQRKHQHLINLGNALNLEIGKLRNKERLTSLQKLERKAEELEKKRKGTLYQRYLHFQEKIKALEAESIKLKSEIIDIKNDAGQFNQNSKAVVFRLPDLEQVLKDNYFCHPDKIGLLVKQAYLDNEKCLKADVGAPVEDRLVRGFQLVLDLDSGEILEKKETTCDKEMAESRPVIMAEVKK